MNGTAIQSTCILHYCDKCGTRISRADLGSGIVRLDEEGKATCTRCAQKQRTSAQIQAPPQTQPSQSRESKPDMNVLRRDGRRATPHHAPPKLARSSDRRHADTATGTSPGNRVLWIGGALAVLLLMIAGLLLLRSMEERPKQVATASPAVTQTATAPVAESRPQPKAQPPVQAPVTPTSGKESSPAAAPKTEAAPTPEVKNEPKTEAKSEPKTEAKREVDDYNPREMVARSLLLQAKQAFAAAPEDPWTYQDQLKAIVADHQSTTAGKEAAALLADLKVPPRPVAPTGEQAEGLVLKPGLLARYFSGKLNDRRKKLHVAQPLTSLDHNYGGNGPASGVPGDNFETEAMGVLRISEPGDYTFIFIGDDFLDVWIDGKCIGNAQWDRQVTAKVNLQAGDHPIKIVHSDSISNSSFRLKWKRPGQKNEENIPAEALFHYGKPEEEK